MASDNKGTRAAGRLPADTLAALAGVAEREPAVAMLLGHVGAVESELREARAVAVEAVTDIGVALLYKDASLRLNHDDDAKLQRLQAAVKTWRGGDRGE